MSGIARLAPWMPGRVATLTTCCQRRVVAEDFDEDVVGVDERVDAHVGPRLARDAPAHLVDAFESRPQTARLHAAPLRRP
jgi:hypothetical protein